MRGNRLQGVPFASAANNPQNTTIMAKKKNESTGLRKLLEDQVADIYYAEKKLLPALKKMAKTAEDSDLSEAFTAHHAETTEQVTRLEEVFAALDMPVKGKKCDAIDGILEEASGIMDEFKGDSALDAALVGAAQKVEHYEIASYGSMVAWAEQLGLDDVASLLSENLEQEKAADEKLSDLAGSSINAAGEEGAPDSAEEDEDNDDGTATRVKKAPARKADPKPMKAPGRKK